MVLCADTESLLSSRDLRAGLPGYVFHWGPLSVHIVPVAVPGAAAPTGLGAAPSQLQGPSPPVWSRVCSQLTRGFVVTHCLVLPAKCEEAHRQQSAVREAEASSLQGSVQASLTRSGRSPGRRASSWCPDPAPARPRSCWRMAAARSPHCPLLGPVSPVRPGPMCPGEGHGGGAAGLGAERVDGGAPRGPPAPRRPLSRSPPLLPDAL